MTARVSPAASTFASVLSLGGAALALLLASGLGPRELAAHPLHRPAMGERYLKLDLRQGHIRVVYGITYASRSGREVRREADIDGDGSIGEAEEERQIRGYRRRISRAVALTVDGEAVDLDWGEPFLGGFAGPVGAGPATVETWARVPLPPRARLIVLEDRAEFDGIYRTTAMIVTEGEVELERAGRGRAPTGRDDRLVFMDLPAPGPPPVRIVTIELLRPEEAEISGAAIRLWGFVGGVALLAVLGLLGLFLFRRVSRRARTSVQNSGRAGDGRILNRCLSER